MKKASWLFTCIASFFLLAPNVFAVDCSTFSPSYKDLDGDGWVGPPSVTQQYTYTFGSSNVNYGMECTINSIPKKVGDCVDIAPIQETAANSVNAMKDKNGNIVKSNTIYPGANDLPGDGVDQDCSGADSSFGGGTTTGVQDILDKVKNFLTMAIVSISGIILIWGGIMYAMAAGDESKTKKARKAMLGAVVGLVVGLLAYTIIGIVASNFA